MVMNGFGLYLGDIYEVISAEKGFQPTKIEKIVWMKY